MILGTDVEYIVVVFARTHRYMDGSPDVLRYITLVIATAKARLALMKRDLVTDSHRTKRAAAFA